jgi:hypothetical protein
VEQILSAQELQLPYSLQPVPLPAPVVMGQYFGFQSSVPPLDTMNSLGQYAVTFS